MKEAVHFYHTPVLALECGYTPDDALELATFNQMTDWATPKNIGPDYWPDATGFKPRCTQIDEAYGARSVLGGDRWNPGWGVCNEHHFPDLFSLGHALWLLENRALPNPQRGRLIHLCQDYASHKGYCGYPSESNRHLGDSRKWWSKALGKVIRRNELLGHWLRPEVDDLAASRTAIIAVSVDLRRALWRGGDMPETSEAIGLLAVAKDDKDLVKRCKAYWLKHTGKAMPDFRPPSPRSEDWRRWCA